uniref:Ubiquitin carboxyl-terminal hydrolase n=1 Tax=Amphimedon queenslandica TaxID=400682 RepID=A0A1X7TNC9_AMPQE
MNLIPNLINDFLFRASRLVKKLKTTPDLQYNDELASGICSSPDSIQACYKLLNALCVGVKENIEILSELISDIFYNDEPPLVEWEYYPHVGPRPTRGYVGLKNAGATCYMNAVLQQLYMISPVRNGVLSLSEPAVQLINETDKTEQDNKGKTNLTKTGRLKDPRAKLEGQQVNLREQHDAFEFFNTLVDSVDEGLKAYNATPIISKVLGGSFADQKICKGCPHRFSREEPFTAINVDIRLHHNLFKSLDSYVKGDLLEGANAYRCEICNKEVDTVKRMCINKLPQVLVIQLKRFDYDWEREMAIKFNDYFEFPKEFDLSPYTAAGLAEIEGERIPFTTTNTDTKKEGGGGGGGGVKGEGADNDDPSMSTKYRLRGILVHSGQASGGHYYSFINVKPPGSDQAKWFKFDDGDVSEAKMEDEEEFRNQTFGGDYTGEVYDHVLKKSHQRRQKRWWSAYLLFYDRIRKDGTDLTSGDDSSCSVPSPIMKLVQKQNLDYLHIKSHFSIPYYQFMKQLLIINYNFAKTQIDANNPNEPMENFEKIGSLCMKLVTKFLFHSGFHTKKTLRGPANDWFDAMNPYLYYSSRIRRWFCDEVFIKHRERFCAYLLECPSTELRNMFAKLIPHLCHITNKDEKFEIHLNTATGIHVSEHLFSDIALNQLLTLLKKEVSDHSRHLHQYFQVFLAYAHKGAYEGTEVLPNPYADPELCEKLSNDLLHWLYERTSIQQSTTYVKKLIEDNSPIEETLRFLGFCSWENWEFSAVVIADLLMEIATVQPFDMRPYLDLLYHLLTMADSWQHTRIRAMFLGLQDRVDGMMTMIQHGQTHVVQQKRAYLCIKFIINLCSRCQLTMVVLDEDVHLKRLWQFSIQWLQNELDRRQYTTSTYPYTGWSPPAQSNEVSNSIDFVLS